MSIRTEMPLLARHEGEWSGVYTHVDAAGKVIDQHKSHLSCRFPETGEYDYQQTNVYTWDDGRHEEFSFPAQLRAGRIWFDTERIEGSAWEVDSMSIILHWRRKDIEDACLYEMIQLSECGQHRTRTWHWLHRGELFQRTLIKEEKVSPSEVTS